MQLSESTGVLLLAISQRAFDNAGASRNLHLRPRYGAAFTCVLLLVALALAVVAVAVHVRPA